jgi:hypothetical protein
LAGTTALAVVVREELSSAHHALRSGGILCCFRWQLLDN